MQGGPAGNVIVGVFGRSDEAQEAVERLRAVGVPEGEMAIATGGDGDVDGARSNVAGGAATGAIFGVLAGGLLGWMLAIGAIAVPGVGPVPNPGFGGAPASAVLSTTLGAMAIGALLGALVGALVALGLPRAGAREPHDHLREGRAVVTVRPSGIDAERAQEILWASDASEVYTYAVQRQHEQPVQRDQRRWTAYSDDKEQFTMDNQGDNQGDNKDQLGQSPNTVTGTEGTIDPATGAYGTAGTPLTTGYGVSGSTAGTGTHAGREEEEEGDYAGATPDTKSYDSGGRASEDAKHGQHGEPSDETVTTKYAEAGMYEGAHPRSQGEQDVYETSPDYKPNVAQDEGDMPINADAAEHYSGASVEEAPTYAKINVEPTHESEGTDIPGSR